MPNENVFNNSPANLKTSLYVQGQNTSVVPLGANIYNDLNSECSFINPAVGSLYDRLQTAEYSTIFSILSLYGITYLRDVITTAGSGAITNTGNGYILSTTTAANDSATLDSAERGHYSANGSYEVGIGVIVPVAPISTQKAIWGITDGSNGLYFGQDSTDVYVGALRNGTETKVYKSNWNVDKLDGTGSSGLTLDTSRGYLYQIRYGSINGVAEFRVVMIQPSTNEQVPIVCERLYPITGTIIGDTNQPIRARIENGATAPAQPFSITVRGRGYANLGTPANINRTTSERRLTVATNNAAFVPLVSFQRQAIFPAGSGRANSINVVIDSFDLIPSNDIMWQLRLNSTLTGASFVSPSETPSIETCVLTDTSATAIDVATGIKLTGGLASSGQKTTLNSFTVNTVLPGTQPATLCVRNITAVTGTVSAVLRVREEW